MRTPGTPATRLAWLDLEMTGLDVDHDEILEMAIVITEQNLDIVAESKSWVFKCPQAKIDGMDSWNTKTHGDSGLIAKVAVSTLDYARGEAEALAFMREWVAAATSPMCGNSIHQDRKFLQRYLPQLHDYFHYRNFDVSTFKLACSYWSDKFVDLPQKDNAHQALADVYESIAEMREYKKLLF